jgi:hypothetical protein
MNATKQVDEVSKVSKLACHIIIKFSFIINRLITVSIRSSTSIPSDTLAGTPIKPPTFMITVYISVEFGGYNAEYTVELAHWPRWPLGAKIIVNLASWALELRVVLELESFRMEFMIIKL